jgi:hypothetical protein
MLSLLIGLRRFLTVAAVVLGCAYSRADQWIKPTSEELQMTAEPEAPDAAAVILYREEHADDKIHFHTTYIRLKILSEKGKEYADQEINYQGGKFKITDVAGRTIHRTAPSSPLRVSPTRR